MRPGFLSRFIRKRKILVPEGFGNALFASYPNQKTRPPLVVPYLNYCHGTLPKLYSKTSTESKRTHKSPRSVLSCPTNPPIYFYRFRIYLGTSDPVNLPRSVQDRKKLAQILISQERRDKNKKIWTVLLTYPPTHVIHFFWKSQVTQTFYEVLYISLCFNFQGFSCQGLAKSFSDYFVECLENSNDLEMLCPPRVKLFAMQQFLLVLAFFRLRWHLYPNEQNMEHDRRH